MARFPTRNHVLILAGLLVVSLLAAVSVARDQDDATLSLIDSDETTEAAAEPAPEEAGFSPEKVHFAVQFRDDIIPYRVFGIFVMPGETVPLEAVFTKGEGSVSFDAGAGDVRKVDEETWQWTAPEEPGLYPLEITDEAAGGTITLNAFVKVPFDHRSDRLNGYRIGDYQDKPLHGNPVYDQPDGFVEVTPENRDVQVAPHFTLGQFVCKQTSDYPKYLILRERLLLKLEMLLQELNEEGTETQTFHVMSGFRTPYYNKSIGNRTTYSRHLYGGAADIFVDTNDDNYMDDLNDDGDVTTEDARVLSNMVEGMTDETWYGPFVGGLGVYSPAPHRGPFIHVDVRGETARW